MKAPKEKFCGNQLRHWHPSEEIGMRRGLTLGPIKLAGNYGAGNDVETTARTTTRCEGLLLPQFFGTQADFGTQAERAGKQDGNEETTAGLLWKMNNECCNLFLCI